MIFDDRSKDPLGVGDIVAIVDAELEVDASSRLGRHVREDVPPDLVVGTIKVLLSIVRIVVETRLI